MLYGKDRINVSQPARDCCAHKLSTVSSHIIISMSGIEAFWPQTIIFLQLAEGSVQTGRLCGSAYLALSISDLTYSACHKRRLEEDIVGDRILVFSTPTAQSTH